MSGRTEAWNSFDIRTWGRSNIENWAWGESHTITMYGLTMPGAEVRLEGTDSPWPPAFASVWADYRGRFRLEHTLDWWDIAEGFTDDIYNEYGFQRGFRIGVSNTSDLYIFQITVLPWTH